MMNKLTLNSVLEELYSALNTKRNENSQILSNSFEEKKNVVIFLSATDGNERAYVVNGRGTTIEEAWKKATQEIRKTLFLKKIKPLWVKADLVTSMSTVSFTDFMIHIANTKKNYFRKGISFDRNFQNAFLEQEVNANVFFHNWKDGHADLAIENINNYIKKYRNSSFRLKEAKLKEKDIYTFQTISVFHDGQEVHEQYNGVLNNGCRVVDEINSHFTYDIVDKSSCFLKKQVYENGYFRYGYFPAFNKEINTYNILRHASTTYSLAEAYELTKNEELLAAIERSLEYLVKEAIAIHTIDGRECAFVLEKVADNEIKLGANGHAILAMSKYTKVTGDKTYLPMLEKLANGILQFQQENGSFVHILNEDLTIKDEFRTIYYDGEAAFALMRLYDIDKNERWLKAVEKGFEYFVANDYWKYGDHWMSYASNELFQYRPERKYAELNLRNAARRLDFCLTRETAYPTLLELLMASFNLITYMKENNLHLDLLADFDEEKLNRAIQHRVKHQLNSYFWPEMAMYFKVPKNIVNSFYIRHHSYRVRIDDIEHNISGYCSYYWNVLMREEKK